MNKIPAPRRPRARIVPCAGILVLTLVAFLGPTGCKGKHAERDAAAPRPIAVRVAPVRFGPMREVVRYVGTVRSTREVRVLARLAGSVVDLPFEEGEKVDKGRRLAILGVPDLYQRSGRAEAEISRARLEADFACEQAKTDAILFEQEAIPKVRYDGSKRKCETARKAVLVASYSLGEIGATRGKSIERAPFDGRVLDRMTEPGEHVFPGKPILLYGSLSLELRVGVGERDIARGIAVGTGAQVRFRQGAVALAGKAIDVTVTRVAPMAKGPARTVEVRLALPEDLFGQLPYGASADVSFILEQSDRACGVPRIGVKVRDDDPRKGTVFTVRDGHAKEVPVTLGVHDGDFIAVEPALPTDAVVVTSNLDGVKDGVLLFAVNASEPVKP